MRAALVVAVSLAVGPSLPAAAELYRWVDADGRLHVTTELHEVPEHARGSARQAAAEERKTGGTLAPRGADAPAAIGDAAPKAATRRPSFSPARVYSVKVERAGTGMLVMVQLNDRVSAPFLIDTGASDVLVPQSVADDLGLRIGPETRRARYHTANGVVEHPVILLDSVELGGARVESVPASVSPNLGVGLLGLSFFNHFRYEIDAAEGVVRMRPNGLVEQGLIRGGRSEAQWRAEFGSLEARRRDVLLQLEGTQASHGRERARLLSLVEDLDRDLELLGGEADHARVPLAWRQ